MIHKKHSVCTSFLDWKFANITTELSTPKGSVLDHRSLPPVFESRRGHIWRLFHLLHHLITFGGHSAHLAYHVHNSSCKTSIIISTLVKHFIFTSFTMTSVKSLRFHALMDLSAPPLYKYLPTARLWIWNYMRIHKIQKNWNFIFLGCANHCHIRL